MNVILNNWRTWSEVRDNGEIHVVVRTQREQQTPVQFRGVVLDETDSHYRVAHESNPLGELFAKRSQRVNCIVTTINGIIYGMSVKLATL